MATFKATVQEHHKKADKSYNVKIRVTHKRKVRYLSTNVYVFKEDMTRSLNIKNEDITKTLDAIVKKYIGYINELGLIADSMDVDEIIEYIKNRAKEEFGQKNKSISFFEYAENMIQVMISEGRKSTSDNYKTMLNSLERFIGRELTFADINVTFLKKYQEFLRENNTGARGVSLYMGLIRAVFNAAIKDLNDYEKDITVIKGSPFSKYNIPAVPPVEKRSIPIDKICAMQNLPYSNLPRENMAKDIFMLSFFLIGMNSVDLYNCDDYSNGRITYKRTKTSSRRDDEALFSVKVPSIALPLIEKYKDPTKQRVFNFYHTYADRKTFNKILNMGLKFVGKRIDVDALQYYAARHSWATIARNDLRIDKYTVHEALNHVGKSINKNGCIHVPPFLPLVAK